MKLSKLSTDRALDVLCELTPYVDNITSDPALTDSIGTVVDGMDKLNRNGQYIVAVNRICAAVPVLLKTHRPDVYGILSIVNEKSTEEIGKQPLKQTIQQFKDALMDEELVSFFKSYARQGQTEQSVPSAGSPGSE